MIDPKVVDEVKRKEMEKILAQGIRPTIVAMLIDYFGDGKIAFCQRCGNAVIVRPYLSEAVVKYELKVLCFGCSDKRLLKGAMMQDFAKIESADEGYE